MSNCFSVCLRHGQRCRDEHSRSASTPICCLRQLLRPIPKGALSDLPWVQILAAHPNSFDMNGLTLRMFPDSSMVTMPMRSCSAVMVSVNVFVWFGPSPAVAAAAPSARTAAEGTELFRPAGDAGGSRVERPRVVACGEGTGRGRWSG